MSVEKVRAYFARFGMEDRVNELPQSSATVDLAAAALGKTLGMLDDNFFNAIIFLSIVTTIPIPSLVRCLIQKESPSFEVTEDEAFVVPDESEGQDDVL